MTEYQQEILQKFIDALRMGDCDAAKELAILNDIKVCDQHVTGFHKYHANNRPDLTVIFIHLKNSGFRPGFWIENGKWIHKEVTVGFNS